jgi:hypothetical protein
MRLPAARARSTVARQSVAATTNTGCPNWMRVGGAGASWRGSSHSIRPIMPS